MAYSPPFCTGFHAYVPVINSAMVTYKHYIGSIVDIIALLFYQCVPNMLLLHCLCYYLPCPPGMKIILKSDEHGYLYVWQLATIVPIKLSQNQGPCYFCNLTDVSNLLLIWVGKLPHELIYLLK